MGVWCVGPLPELENRYGKCSRRNEGCGCAGGDSHRRRAAPWPCRPGGAAVGRRDPQRAVGGRGRRPLRCQPLRTQRRPARHPGRPLFAEASDQGRRGGTPRAAVANALVRDADHRTLPATRVERRGGAGRDVPGRRLGAAGGGHHRGAVGRTGQPEHRQRVEPEDLRPDRRVAAAADRRRVRLRLPRRHLAEAKLGRRGPQRCRARGGRRAEPTVTAKFSALPRA